MIASSTLPPFCAQFMVQPLVSLSPRLAFLGDAGGGATGIEQDLRCLTPEVLNTLSVLVNQAKAVVDDIHHSIRVPKYEVVTALLEAAVAQADRVGRQAGKSPVSHQ
ncbi:hypothetical protein OIE43_43750 [Streptomyces pseudovenezuelae]|uniref:Uncharacterized protein n=1 Tax=Streptomyces pseudovenezuelae TaxID=67350 RepID=A0ABZ1XBL2_9ACTN|nr:hypothetical protein [Streptomyces pseudovenezuelae]